MSRLLLATTEPELGSPGSRLVRRHAQRRAEGVGRREPRRGRRRRRCWRPSRRTTLASWPSAPASMPTPHSRSRPPSTASARTSASCSSPNPLPELYRKALRAGVRDIVDPNAELTDVRAAFDAGDRDRRSAPRPGAAPRSRPIASARSRWSRRKAVPARPRSRRTCRSGSPGSHPGRGGHRRPRRPVRRRRATRCGSSPEATICRCGPGG